MTYTTIPIATSRNHSRYPSLGKLITFFIVIIFASTTLNVMLSLVASRLNGLLFLDTIGTAIAAVSLGPWWGALVGAMTNLVVSEFPCHQQYFNYLIVNVICGLLWGYLARGWPKLFSSDGNYSRLFGIILFFGAVVGFFSAALSLFTTFNFVWRLSEVNPDTFRQWHLTDEYYRWLMKSKQIDLQHGTLLDILYRDIIAILPDKMVAICIAALVIYYVVPHDLLMIRGRRIATDIILARVGLVSFIIVYAACFGIIAYQGTISIDPNKCTVVSHNVIPAQVIIWLLPLLLASYFLYRTFKADGSRILTGNPVVHIEKFEPKRQKYVYLVYKDILTILAGVFAVLVALKQGGTTNIDSVTVEIGNLLSNGLGIAAFFGLSLFVPGFLFRFFGVGPGKEEE